MVFGLTVLFSRYRFGEPWSDDVNVEFGHNGCNHPRRTSCVATSPTS